MTAADALRPLPPRQAYELWAPCYDAETVVSALEDAAVAKVTPPLRGRSLLDVGCGTGRRLPPRSKGLRLAVGVDLTWAMLAARPRRRRDRAPVAAADARALPLRSGVFDLLWCRLVLGHVPDLVPAYRELARVAADRAVLVVTDFHPRAAQAGHTRSFRDAEGALRTVEHHIHPPDIHAEVAERCGWPLVGRVDLHVGPPVRHFYSEAGALDRYAEQEGMALVILYMFAR